MIMSNKLKYEVYGVYFKELSEDPAPEWIYDSSSKEELAHGEAEYYLIYDCETKEIAHCLCAMSENLGWVLGFIHAKQPIHKTEYFSLTFPKESKSQARALPYLAKVIQEAKEIEASQEDDVLAAICENKDGEVKNLETVKILTDFCLDCPHYFDGTYSDACADCMDAEVMQNPNDNILDEMPEEDNEQPAINKLKDDKLKNDLAKTFRSFFAKTNIQELKDLNESLNATHEQCSEVTEEQKSFDIESLRSLTRQSVPKFDPVKFFENEIYPKVISKASQGENFIFFYFDISTMRVNDIQTVIEYLEHLGFEIEPWRHMFRTYYQISW